MKRLSLVLAVGLSVSCGTSGGGGGNPSGTGAKGATGGATTGGMGGSPAGGSGGAAGSTSGGSGGVAGCAPPSDTTRASLCLTIVPDTITVVPGDPALDGAGILFVQIFDTPSPPDSAAPLASTALPAQPSDGSLAEAELGSLVAAPLSFDNLPATVYVRAVFVDDFTFFSSPNGAPLAGTWVGGIDLTKGFVQNPVLQPVALTTGVATSSTLSLSPYRKLTLTVSRLSSLSPAGNGQGPLTMIAVANQQITSNNIIFGVGGLACANLSGTGPVTVNGALYGNGPYWVTAGLDDFGKGALSAGSLASLELSGSNIIVPSQNQLSFAPNDYVVQHSIQLSVVVPGDPGTDSVSCP